MKRGIILTRKHGGKELTALSPALPYHEQVARFKKDFQAIVSGVHEKYEEAFLVPVEAAASKRVRFVTEKRAAELAETHANAQEQARKAAALSDEVKSAMANVADAKNTIAHFERALQSVEKQVVADSQKETRAKNILELSERLNAAKAELESRENVLKKIQKADAEAEAKAEAKTPTESK